MTHFIRDVYNKTLVDIDVFYDDHDCQDFSVYVDIELYTLILLKRFDGVEDEQVKFMKICSELQQLRGTWFECTITGMSSDVDVNDFITDQLKQVCALYPKSLFYVRD